MEKSIFDMWVSAPTDIGQLSGLKLEVFDEKSMADAHTEDCNSVLAGSFATSSVIELLCMSPDSYFELKLVSSVSRPTRRPKSIRTWPLTMRKRVSA